MSKLTAAAGIEGSRASNSIWETCEYVELQCPALFVYQTVSCQRCCGQNEINFLLALNCTSNLSKCVSLIHSKNTRLK